VADGGGYNLEQGLTLMDERLSRGKLRVASHLGEWFDKYRGYHRENGVPVKVDDDLMSATRVGVMAIREARPLEKEEEAWKKFTPIAEWEGSAGGVVGAYEDTRRQSDDWNVFEGV
jgi:hypothetical protein